MPPSRPGNGGFIFPRKAGFTRSAPARLRTRRGKARHAITLCESIQRIFRQFDLPCADSIILGGAKFYLNYH